MPKDLLDRFTINFKSPVDEEGIRRVFSKLAQDKQVSVNWTFGVSCREDPRLGVGSERRLQKASGTISDITGKQGFVSLPFDLYTSEVEDSPAYTSLRFQLIPDYDEHEYDKKVLEAIDGFRKYFKNNFPWTE